MSEGGHKSSDEGSPVFGALIPTHSNDFRPPAVQYNTGAQHDYGQPPVLNDRGLPTYTRPRISTMWTSSTTPAILNSWGEPPLAKQNSGLPDFQTLIASTSTLKRPYVDTLDNPLVRKKATKYDTRPRSPHVAAIVDNGDDPNILGLLTSSYMWGPSHFPGISAPLLQSPVDSDLHDMERQELMLRNGNDKLRLHRAPSNTVEYLIKRLISVQELKPSQGFVPLKKNQSRGQKLLPKPMARLDPLSPGISSNASSPPIKGRVSGLSQTPDSASNTFNRSLAPSPTETALSFDNFAPMGPTDPFALEAVASVAASNSADSSSRDAMASTDFFQLPLPFDDDIVQSLQSLTDPSGWQDINLPSFNWMAQFQSTMLRYEQVSERDYDKESVKSFSITPMAPTSHPEINPFAYAQLKDLSGKINKECPVGGGSFADVYMGYWVTNTRSTKVAIKELRSHIYSQANIEKLDKRLRRELRIWGNLNHPNIVSLLGVTSDLGSATAMVCQWMSQGTLSDYLEKEQDNLNLQERLNLCINIADGLSYLHSQKVIHGDLTPANVLMDNKIAHLSDFGLSNVIDELQGPSFLTSKVGGSPRWIAPELLLNATLTMSCDVYSFASVAFYTITGMYPYAHLRSDNAVIAEIFKSSNKFPSRPAQAPLLTDACWEIFTTCWATDPEKRPDINAIKHRLRRLVFL